jgi:hypothetical protein
MSRKSDLQKLYNQQYTQQTTEAQQRLDWAQKAYDYNTLQAQRGYDTTQASSERNRLADIAGLNLSVWNNAADTGNVRGRYNQYAQGQGLTSIANAFNQAKYGNKNAFEQTNYANTTALSQAQQEFENFKANLELQKQADALSLKNYGSGRPPTVIPPKPQWETYAAQIHAKPGDSYYNYEYNKANAAYNTALADWTNKYGKSIAGYDGGAK